MAIAALVAGADTAAQWRGVHERACRRGPMEYLWIVSSIAAAFFQSLRLAALKQLNQTLSAVSYTHLTLPTTPYV